MKLIGESNYGDELQNSPHFPALAHQNSGNKEMASHVQNFLEEGGKGKNAHRSNFSRDNEMTQFEDNDRFEEEGTTRPNNMRRL